MITDNIKTIREQIRIAALACGRDPAEIKLCAATKMNDSNKVREAIAAGVDCCGENRVQELTDKLSDNAYDGAPIHFIGHLQTNKVRHVVGKVDLIQSVDSIHLLDAIQKEAQRQQLVQDVLLQLNIGNEESKSGFSVTEIHNVCSKIAQYPNIRAKGFMIIPPISHISGENRKFFQEMYNLSVDITAKKYDNVLVDILSMGMSNDFTDAIACGSNMIRIGTAIFGPRKYK